MEDDNKNYSERVLNTDDILNEANIKENLDYKKEYIFEHTQIIQNQVDELFDMFASIINRQQMLQDKIEICLEETRRNRFLFEDKQESSIEVELSIIIPVYNTSKYLGKCISSLEGCLWKKCEIIFVNDGSEDDSLLILKEYSNKDNRVKIINKANSGYGDSMNVGIANALGKYIAILESDDFLEKDTLYRMVSLAERLHCDVVYGNYNIYNILKDDIAFCKNLPDVSYYTILDFDEKKKLFMCAPAIWRGIYNRKYLVQNDINFLPSPGASYQDTSFFFKCITQTDKIVLIKEPVVNYRVGHESASIASKEKAFCISDEINEIERFILKNNIKSIYSEFFYFVFLRGRWNMDRLSGENRTKFRKWLIKKLQEMNMRYEIEWSTFEKDDIREIEDLLNE